MRSIPKRDNSGLRGSQSQEKENFWIAKIGEVIKHKTFGIGIIESIEVFPGRIYVNIRFANDREMVSRKFTTEVSSNLQYFTVVTVPSELKKLIMMREELIEQHSRGQHSQSGLSGIYKVIHYPDRREFHWKHPEWQEIEDEWNKFDKQQRRQEDKRRIKEQRLQQKEEQRREEERIRHELEKQTLLRRLRGYFDRDFLKAYDFYLSHCTVHISPEEYKKEKRNYVRHWANRNLAFSPDDEQVDAIAAVECHVQVIARAGSGKTATLINRALFLQQHCGIAPHQMLLLAFNRKAAKEMRERLSNKLEDTIPHVMTFHALANALVQPEGKILIDEPDGEQSKSRVLQSVIDDYLRTDLGYENIRTLMMMYFRQDWERILLSGYSKDRNEMLQYRRSLRKEGIDGTYLKSFGEKVIADFLFEHNIKYKYERVFKWNGINYRPDFTIPVGENGGVIIEYFGLEGDPDYDEMSEQKRQYWRRNPNWQFIEFSHSDLTSRGSDGLRKLLQQSLEACGISCKRLSEDEIWFQVKDRAIDGFTSVVRDFIQRCRKLSLTSEQLARMVDRYMYASHVEQRFLNLVQVFYKSYLERLRTTGEEDFDGLMQQAIVKITEGQTEFRRVIGSGDLRHLRYIFIDEYQDFSELFYRMIEAIRKQNTQVQIFCVGDDWQAINGYAGCDLKFYQDFTTLFQPARQLYITTNYRSAKSIVITSNALMSNSGIPARAYNMKSGIVQVANLEAFKSTQKEYETHSGDKLTPAVLRLVRKFIGDGEEVILLSRKNNLPWFVNYRDRRNITEHPELDRFLMMIRRHLSESERDRVSISTTHQYKGLEKHTVIVLDAIYSCYPLIHPNIMFTRILGDTVERTIEEERRLFYVTLTRAVERLIIITDETKQSPFLKGLWPSVSHLNWSHYLQVHR